MFIENLEESDHYLIILAIHWVRLSSVIIHLLLTYLLIEQESTSIFIQNTIDSIYHMKNLYNFFQIIIYCSKFFQIFIMIIVFLNNHTSILFKIGIKITKFFIIISEIDLLFSGMILLINLP